MAADPPARTRTWSGGSRTILPPIAVATFALVAGVIVWSGVAAGTLGFDFLAYHQAAARVVAGQPLYDLSVQQTGGFGFFYYPPPFILLILPFALLAPAAATWLWLTLSIAAIAGALWLMPVRPATRWLMVLLSGLSWPVAYALKLGQVGPLLLLLFAIGWRWIDRPGALGTSAAVGAIVKIQPGIVLAWAVLTRRWSSVAIGAVVLLLAAALATLIVPGGLSTWTDYLTVLRNVSDPITTPHNFTPGALLNQSLGVPVSVAIVVQVASVLVAGGLVVVAAARATPVTSYLAAVVASQLLSPVLWDHYALLLLLPAAWLVERGYTWAVAIPLATSVIVLFVVPPAVYPAAFWLTLVAVVVAGIRDESRARPASSEPAG